MWSAAQGVLANDTDPDGDSLTALDLTNPAHGTLFLNADGSFAYTPAAGFSGTDSFTYDASDGTLDSPPATVTLVVIDHPPVANADSYTASEGEPFVVGAAQGVLANDTDPDGDPLTAIALTAPANGTVVLNADGSFVYTPTSEFAGTDSFTYEASDGALDSSAATVALTFVNGLPLLAPINNQTVNPGTLLTLTALATSPRPGVQLTYSLDPGGPAGAAIDPTDGVFTFTPTAAQGPGIYPVTARVTDNGTPELSATEEFTIVVLAEPQFTAIATPAITFGTASTTLSGNLAAGTVVPQGTVSILLDGMIEAAAIDPATGNFSATFPTATLAASATAFPIQYSFAGSAILAPAGATAGLIVNRANQTITWANPGAIVYGTPLGPAQLDATVLVPGPDPTTGALTYSVTAGTILDAGAGRVLTVSAAATAKYNAASMSVILDVSPAPLTVTVDSQTKVYGQPNPAFDVLYGGFVNKDTPAALGGALTFSTPAGIASDVGTYEVAASGLTSSNYAIQYLSGSLAITPAAQTIDWTTQADIGYGTPLGPAQLDAKVAVPGPAPSGPLTYSQAAGLVLHAGSGQLLTVVAAATLDYRQASATVAINVRPAPLTIEADDLSIVSGQPVPALTATFVGLVNGDTPASLAMSPVLFTVANSMSTAGSYPIMASGAVSPDYAIAFVNGTLDVIPGLVTVPQRLDSKGAGREKGRRPRFWTYRFVLGWTPRPRSPWAITVSVPSPRETKATPGLCH